MSVTFERTRALSREDLGFLTWDHPIVRGALDLLLGSEAGNSAFGMWQTPGPEAVLLEIYAVVECVAPAALHVDRFLAPTPIRAVVDHTLVDQSDDAALLAAKLQAGDIFRLLDKASVKKKLLPAMLAKAQLVASERMARIVEATRSAMELQLQDEIERLEDLAQINDHVRSEEIEAARKQKTDLSEAISSARLRLDAVRLILRVPEAE
jgi:ATP-dependent helicase HepA